MIKRVRCLIPNCRRTTSKPMGSEIICGTHWRSLVPQRHRRFYSLVCRRYKRRPTEKLERVAYFSWERCKRIALRRTSDPFDLMGAL